MNIVEILKADYSHFPTDQTYSIYSDDVYFKDPMNEFRGRDRYHTMLGFIETWFRNPQMDLHDIQQNGNEIRTDWTLNWTTPLPWQPRIHIPGWSELKLNDEGLICSHVDYWKCSKWDVVQQHIPGRSD